MTSDIELPPCFVCGKEAVMNTVSTWFGRVVGDAEIDALFCPSCYESTAPQGRFMTGLRFGSQIEPGAPMVGAFQPVKSSEEIVFARTDAFYAPFWLDLENQFLEIFNEFGSKFMNFTISSHFYKGMKVTLVWDRGQLSGLTVQGTSPSRKLQLDVYQTYRLREMGLIETGLKDRTWDLQFQPHEVSYENVARVISHILEFGYMLKPARSLGISPQLDIKAEDFRR